MSLLGGPLTTLAALVVAAVVVVFAVYMIVEDGWAPTERAAAKTSRRALGVATGAGATATAAGAVGAEVVFQLPELAIAAVGVGAIMTGISWKVAAAVMLVVYLGAEAVNGGPRY